MQDQIINGSTPIECNKAWDRYYRSGYYDKKYIQEGGTDYIKNEAWEMLVAEGISRGEALYYSFKGKTDQIRTSALSIYKELIILK